MARRARKSEEVVSVIYRAFPSHKGDFKPGEVIALFPEIPADVDGYLCVSYMHVGQHGAADPEYVVRITRPARPSEYRDLAAELRRIGYKLWIRKRATRTMRYTRMYRAATR